MSRRIRRKWLRGRSPLNICFRSWEIGAFFGGRRGGTSTTIHLLPTLASILMFFCLLLFKGTFTSFFKDKKSSHKTVGINVFLYYFCLMIEGSGSGRTKTYGSYGSGSATLVWWRHLAWFPPFSFSMVAWWGYLRKRLLSAVLNSSMTLQNQETSGELPSTPWTRSPFVVSKWSTHSSQNVVNT